MKFYIRLLVVVAVLAAGAAAYAYFQLLLSAKVF